MNITPTLLKKYFSGTCTPEEEAQVIEYLTREDGDLSLLEDLLEEEKERVKPREIPPTMLKSLIYGIRKAAYPEFLKPHQPANHIKWWYSVGIAAVCLPLMIFLGLWVSHGYRNGPAVAAIDMEKWDTVTNTTNETRKAILPDGSAVWLTARSSFSYQPARYSTHQRIIRLEGEGFFDVKSDPLHPFTVYHGAINTQVLGTAFNIEAYGNEEDIRVSLVRGSVAIGTATDTALFQPIHRLQPGEQLIYRRQTGKIRVKPLLYRDEAMWTKGWLILDDVPLTAALKRLERQYGLEIVVPETITGSNKRVTAVFKGGTPYEILQNMLFAHRLRYKEKGKVIYIERMRTY